MLFHLFCIIFRQFCSGDTIVRRTFIAALFGGTFGLMLHTCLMIPTNNNFSLSALCSEYAIANIFVDLSMIFVSVFFFSVFCLVFVLFWILDLYVYFSLCICCGWWAPFNVFLLLSLSRSVCTYGISHFDGFSWNVDNALDYHWLGSRQVIFKWIRIKDEN